MTVKRALEKVEAGARATDGLLRRSFDADVRAVDEDARTIDVVASSESLDAHGTIIEQNFDLARYKRNPVVLFNHNLQTGGWIDSGDREAVLPIARAEDVEVKGGKLTATLRFATEGTDPFHDKVFSLMAQKILRGVSIGFRMGPKTRVTDEYDADGNKKLTPSGRVIRRIKRAEIAEISVVPIGSNPDAVSRAQADAEFRAFCGSTSQQENQMDPEELLATERKRTAELQRQLDEASKRIAAAPDAAQLETVTKRAEAAEKRVVELEAERDAEKNRADALEVEQQKRDVEDLVRANAITPAEREEFAELRASNPELFAKMAESRRKNPHKLTEKTTPDEDKPGENKAAKSGTAAADVARKARDAAYGDN